MEEGDNVIHKDLGDNRPAVMNGLALNGDTNVVKLSENCERSESKECAIMDKGDTKSAVTS